MGICCCIAGAGGWAYLAFVACSSRFLESVREAEGLMVRPLPGVGRNFAAEYSTTWYECLRIGKEGKGEKRGERANYRFALAGQKRDKCTLGRRYSKLILLMRPWKFLVR